MGRGKKLSARDWVSENVEKTTGKKRKKSRRGFMSCCMMTMPMDDTWTYENDTIQPSSSPPSKQPRLSISDNDYGDEIIHEDGDEIIPQNGAVPRTPSKTSPPRNTGDQTPPTPDSSKSHVAYPGEGQSDGNAHATKKEGEHQLEDKPAGSEVNDLEVGNIGKDVRIKKGKINNIFLCFLIGKSSRKTIQSSTDNNTTKNELKS